MKVLVCGSRNWQETSRIWEDLRTLPVGTHVIHGAAKGADSMCDGIIREMSTSVPGRFTVERFPADWSRGRSAGIVRNIKMLDQKPDLVIAFWSGSSKGTRHTIGEAVKRGIPVRVHYPSGVQNIPL